MAEEKEGMGSMWRNEIRSFAFLIRFRCDAEFVILKIDNRIILARFTCREELITTESIVSAGIESSETF